jgi:hypothetical protein
MHRKPYPFPKDFFRPPLLSSCYSPYKRPLLAGNSPLSSAREIASPGVVRLDTPEFKRVSLRISDSCKAVGRKILEGPLDNLKSQQVLFSPKSSLPHLRPMVHVPSQKALPSIRKTRKVDIEVPLKLLSISFNKRSSSKQQQKLMTFGPLRRQ